MVLFSLSILSKISLFILQVLREQPIQSEREHCAQSSARSGLDQGDNSDGSQRQCSPDA